MGERPARRSVCGRRLRQQERPDQRHPLRERYLNRCGVLFVALSLTAASAAAQDVSLWLDGTASYALPPAGVVDSEAATYALLGGRASAGFDWGSLDSFGRLGSAVAGADGQWLEGTLTAASGARYGSVALRARLSAFGLHYLDPFAYDAVGIDLRPTIAVAVTDRLAASLLPSVSLGGWSTEALEGNLRTAGANAELSGDLGPFRAAVTAGAHAVENGVTRGAFIGAGAEAAYNHGALWTVLRLQLQRSPLETEVGGGVTLGAELRPGVQVQLTAARNVRDPRFGTEGSVALAAGMAVRAVRRSADPPPPVAAIGEPRDGGRVVRFTLRAPDAERVEISGDFTGWEPVGMERTDAGWQWTGVLPAGLHHFGFLVDGEWAVPHDAPGVIDDGWGRENASIVVEP